MRRIWLVVYEHKHGHDIDVATTRNLAHQLELNIVREFRKEEGVPPELTDEQALTDWSELTGGREFIGVEEGVLHEPKRKARHVRKRK